jgi:hypothetical protein
MKRLLHRYAAWLLKDVLTGWQKLHKYNINLIHHQNQLIHKLNEGVKLSNTQVERLQAELKGELH